MKIGLVTNWDEKCAVAEYARNLTEYCLAADKEASFKVVTRPLIFEPVWEQLQDVDVIHFNYCAHAFAGMNPERWKDFRCLRPVIMTVHESSDWMVRRLAKTEIADVFVQHDRFRDGLPNPENVVTIPYGIPEVDISGIKVERKVGTFGCAFPWKGLLPLANVCNKLRFPLEMLLSEPDSEMGKIDWQRMKEEIGSLCPSANISTDWLSQTEVVKRLATCAVIALPFEPCSPITGISASVRLALAAKRPLILTKFFHFADLFDYDPKREAIGWVEGNLEDVLKNEIRYFDIRSPVIFDSYNDMKWSVAAKMYVGLYNQVLERKVVYAGQTHRDV